MEKLILAKPFILQDGKEITELLLDFDALATADFRQIRKLEAQIIDGTSINVNEFVTGLDLSDSFRVATGFLAAVKGTPGLRIDDFMKLPLKDATRLGTKAAFFFADVD